MNMFKPIKNLKQWYPIFFELGLILALLILLSAFNLELGNKMTYQPTKDDFDIPILEDIPKTTHEEIPPAPLKPRVFTEVPDDYIFEDAIDEIPDFSIDNGENMPVPPNHTKNEEDEVIFVPFEQGPKIIGGIKSIYEELDYPERARLAGIEGTVVVQFIVNEKGKVTEAKVVRGIGGGCDEEALRVVKRVTFKPARQRERYVKIQMSIPIKFQLRN